MYMETTIIRGNKQIANFDFAPNEELDLFLRGHDRARGGDDWFIIENLTKSDIKFIKNNLKTEDEIKYLSDIQENDGIDVLLHFCVYVING